jgi:hypothetical protein
MGAIISVVAVASLIILGMLCIMRPVEAPGTVTSEAPSPTALHLEQVPIIRTHIRQR